MEEKKVPESFKAYEDGKHRRYQLLFAVNGGAFALAKLLSQQDPKLVVGNLSMRQLSIGMIVFCVAMTTDIYLFGQKMRHTYQLDSFKLPGKIVLILIGALLASGWLLAA